MRLSLATAALVVLAGCQAATLSEPSASLAPLTPPSTEVATAAAEGGATGMMPAAARAWIECGLREYYTAATPITPERAIALCNAEGRRYQDIYFSEYGYASSNKARFYSAIERQAATELAAIISGETR